MFLLKIVHESKLTLHPNAHLSFIKSELGVTLCAAIFGAVPYHQILRTISDINLL
jgi:hypothetical protein